MLFFRPKMVLVRLLSRGFFSDESFLVDLPERVDRVSEESSMYLSLYILFERSAKAPLVILGWDNYSPTIPRHAHPLGFRQPVKLGCLLEIFLASDPLRIAKPGLGKCIRVTPVTRNFKTPQC